MIHLQIDKLQLKLHGVSAELAESAVSGLEEELRRRLGTQNACQSLIAGAAQINTSELAIGPMHSQAALDAGNLRSLIADRLLDTIEAHMQASAAAQSNGSE